MKEIQSQELTSHICVAGILRVKPSGWDSSRPSPSQGYIITPSIKFAGTHIYTWVERGTVRVMCLAIEDMQSS